MKYGVYLEVSCPSCGALPGTLCTSLDGKTAKPKGVYHSSRRNAALKRGLIAPRVPEAGDLSSMEQDLLGALSRYIDRRIATVLSHTMSGRSR